LRAAGCVVHHRVMILHRMGILDRKGAAALAR
jgi:hypothetical protein